MAKNSRADNHNRKEKWSARLRRLWPAIKGSLVQVHKPCIRKRCPACASGQKHPAWILSVVIAGRRSTRYVQEPWVPEIKHAIKNGRKIEELLQQAAVQLVLTHRKSRRNSVKTLSKS
jgi:hypothetical protein